MLALGCVAGARGAELVADEALGVRVAPGFRVTLYADQDLANDIQAMTLDARGRVVVTGPGYIKTLLDTDGNGQADDKTSCWLRVSSSWAGDRYGGIAIPRVGMEVLVTFLDGDPEK